VFSIDIWTFRNLQVFGDSRILNAHMAEPLRNKEFRILSRCKIFWTPIGLAGETEYLGGQAARQGGRGVKAVIHSTRRSFSRPKITWRYYGTIKRAPLYVPEWQVTYYYKLTAGEGDLRGFRYTFCTYLSANIYNRSPVL